MHDINPPVGMVCFVIISTTAYDPSNVINEKVCLFVLLKTKIAGRCEEQNGFIST